MNAFHALLFLKHVARNLTALNEKDSVFLFPLISFTAGLTAGWNGSGLVVSSTLSFLPPSVLTRLLSCNWHDTVTVLTNLPISGRTPFRYSYSCRRTMSIMVINPLPARLAEQLSHTWGFTVGNECAVSRSLFVVARAGRKIGGKGPAFTQTAMSYR